MSIVIILHSEHTHRDNVVNKASMMCIFCDVLISMMFLFVYSCSCGILCIDLYFSLFFPVLFVVIFNVIKR